MLKRNKPRNSFVARRRRRCWPRSTGSVAVELALDRLSSSIRLRFIRGACGSRERDHELQGKPVGMLADGRLRLSVQEAIGMKSGSWTALLDWLLGNHLGAQIGIRSKDTVISVRVKPRRRHESRLARLV